MLTSLLLAIFIVPLQIQSPPPIPDFLEGNPYCDGPPEPVVAPFGPVACPAGTCSIDWDCVAAAEAEYIDDVYGLYAAACSAYDLFVLSFIELAASCYGGWQACVQSSRLEDMHICYSDLRTCMAPALDALQAHLQSVANSLQSGLAAAEIEYWESLSDCCIPCR